MSTFNNLNINDISSKKVRLLIAEDSSYQRKVISGMLSEDPQIEIVDIARNGEDAINKIKISNPDVLLLDLIMPQMNGLDAFKQIMDYNPTPTIILSAVNPQNMDTSIQALLMGAFDYVIKSGGLGAKILPRFKEELLSKVLLASKSQNKNIFEKENNLGKKNYIRQELVSQTFKFGKYINRLEPIQESEEEKQIDSKKAKNHQNATEIKVKPKIKEVDWKEKIFVEVIEDPIKKDEIKNKKAEITEQSIKKSIDKPKATIKPIENISKSIIKSKKKRNKVLEKTDLTPFKGVHLVSNVIVIGASVGGPRTLKTVLKEIPPNISCPILIVQHLSDPFINTFVKTLDEVCAINIKVAINGE
jgi:chemotaxis response regulator CheB